MSVFSSRLAGLGLAAAGLTALASPAFAQSLTWPPTNTPPEYSSQAIQSVQSQDNGITSLTVAAGLLWTSEVATIPGPLTGGTIVVDFYPPQTVAPADNSVPPGSPNNITFTCNFGGSPVVASPNNFFSSAAITACDAQHFQVTATLNSHTGTSAGSFTLPSFGVKGTGLNVWTPNADPAHPNCGGTSPGPQCYIYAWTESTSSQQLSSQDQELTAVMLTSADAFHNGLTSTANPSCIDIDIFSYHSNGMEFQQPCSSHPGGSQDLADKGYVTLTLVGFLSSDGVHVWNPFDPNATFVLTGSPGGNPQLNIGNQAGVAGILPLTGEYVMLAGVTASPGTSSGPGVCPSTYPASFAAGQIPASSIAPPMATWTNNVPYPHLTAVGQTLATSYEVCDYPDHIHVIGDVSSWATSASLDCTPTKYDDCTTDTQNPADLTVFHYNGVVDWFNFTIGNPNTAYQAFLRLVNKNPATATDATGNTPAGDNNEQAVCLVQGDDGTNGYATLYTNGFNNGLTTSNGNSAQAGLHAGQNAFYPVQTVFNLAGIQANTNYSANPFLLGALTCFHTFKVYMKQVWEEPNGTILNMQ